MADGLGGRQLSWTRCFDVWAELRPVGAVRTYRSGSSHADVSHRVTIRYRDDVSPGMRFAKDRRTFLVLTVFDPDETGRYLVCETRETT